MKRFLLTTSVLFLMLIVHFTNAFGQTRDEKVREDRERVKNDSAWFYDDLAPALESAKESSKPLMVVLRCIP